MAGATSGKLKRKNLPRERPVNMAVRFAQISPPIYVPIPFVTEP